MMKSFQYFLFLLIIINNCLNNYVCGGSYLYVPKYQTFLDARIDRVLNESRSIPIPLRSTYESTHYKFLEIISAIRENYFIAALQLYEESNPKVSLNLIITTVYDGNFNGGEKVIEFLNQMKNDSDKYYGYRLFYDQLIENNHQYSSLTTIISYQIINVLNLNESENVDLIYLLNKLPQSFRQFVWTRSFFIKNIGRNGLVKSVFVKNYENEKLYLKSQSSSLSLWNNNTNTNLINNWNIQPMENGYYFYIKNSLNENEYLYADVEVYDPTGLTRHLFTSINTNDDRIVNPEALKWQIEPTKYDYFFKIKNLYLDEYLFATENITEFNGKYMGYEVQMKNLENCEIDGCLWQIQNIPNRFINYLFID